MCSQMHKSSEEKAPVSRLLFVRLNGAVRAVWLSVREPDCLGADGRALFCRLWSCVNPNKQTKLSQHWRRLPATHTHTHKAASSYPLHHSLECCWYRSGAAGHTAGRRAYWFLLQHRLSSTCCKKPCTGGSLNRDTHFTELHHVVIMDFVKWPAGAQQLLDIETMLLLYLLT